MVRSATAHTLFTNFFVDGVDQGNSTCVRMSNIIQNATDPLPDVTTPDMACGANGETGVARTCAVQPGSSITLEYRYWPDGSIPGSIDASHKGPCAVYMKKVDNATQNGNAAGDGWFKIFSMDYDSASSQWCTEKIMANDGHMSVMLPTDLTGGDYLLRSEILALQQADKTPADPQSYIGCAQIFLSSSGNGQPTDTVAIPGYINMTANTAALTFNIYSSLTALPYPMFGPPTYTYGLRSKHDVQEHTNVPMQKYGLTPGATVLEVGNWCGIELDAYSDEAGCWNASANCFTQETECYNSAGPTGGENCNIWNAKCTTIQSDCKAGDFKGPPNKGAILTPSPQHIQPLPPFGDGSTNGAQTVPAPLTTRTIGATASSSGSVFNFTTITASPSVAASAESSLTADLSTAPSSTAVSFDSLAGPSVSPGTSLPHSESPEETQS